MVNVLRMGGKYSVETFELCKRLHELKPDWQPIGSCAIKYKGQDPQIYHNDVPLKYYDGSPKYTIEYLLEKLPQSINTDIDSGIGILFLESTYHEFSTKWAISYKDIEGFPYDDSLVCRADEPLAAVLKLAIVMAEKGLV